MTDTDELTDMDLNLDTFIPCTGYNGECPNPADWVVTVPHYHGYNRDRVGTCYQTLSCDSCRQKVEARNRRILTRHTALRCTWHDLEIDFHWRPL